MIRNVPKCDDNSLQLRILGCRAQLLYQILNVSLDPVMLENAGAPPSIRDLVTEAGYETAVLAYPGFNSFESDRFTLHRFLASHRRPGAVALGRAFQRLLSMTVAE